VSSLSLYNSTLYKKERRIVALHRNRRSHGNIIAWPNWYFYEDVMRDYGNAYITYHLVLSDVLPKKGFPVVFHGVKGCEQHTKWSPSYFNIAEVSIVRDYCVKLIGDPERNICESSIFSSTTTLFCSPQFRSRGYWHYRTLQSSIQSYSGITEGGEFVGYYGGLSRAVPGTGSELIITSGKLHFRCRLFAAFEAFFGCQQFSKT
jgi:hypothetical protein